jgi:hypothetical protein
VLIVRAVDQVCLLHPVDRSRVAIAGLQAGAGMAAVLVTADGLRACVERRRASRPQGDGQGPNASCMVWDLAARQFGA